MLTRTVKKKHEKPGPYYPRPIASTLPQAKLDYIVAGSPTWHYSQLKWLRRLLSDPQQYHPLALKARGVELGGMIARIKRELTSCDLSPEEWTAKREQLAKWEGQQSAISLVMESYAKQEKIAQGKPRSPFAGLISEIGRSLSTAPPETEPDHTDPFANC